MGMRITIQLYGSKFTLKKIQIINFNQCQSMCHSSSDNYIIVHSTVVIEP